MFSIKEAKNFFFADAQGKQRIFAGIDRARTSVLKKSGAIVRTFARRSIRKARRKRLSELDPVSLTSYRIAQRVAKDKGYAAPELPVAHSLPGEPPRSIAGDLRKFMFFGFDTTTKTVVVGPAKLSKKGDAPSVLEYGGRSEGSTIAARPYMRPAEKKSRDKYLQLWKDSIV
jgi:hypothetical protein